MTDGVLDRPRLRALLDEPEPRLTVLAAPSGYGKTTLVRGWVRTLDPERSAVVWVAHGAAVTTVDGFWQAVLLSARRLGLLSGEEYADRLAVAESAADPGLVTAGFVADLSPASVLVLDSYEHALTLGAVLDEELVRLVGELPSLRVVVTTRVASSLTDDSYRLRGAVRVLGEQDLTFSAEETAGLLEQHGRVEPGAAGRLHRDTRGYPLALRAALLGGSSVTGRGEDWRRLVAQDLRRQLPEEIGDFVRATAVPPYLDTALARRLTDRDDAAKLLDDLQQRGLGRWIPFAPERPAFQYAETFRDALAGDLHAADPARYGRLAAASARWLHEELEHQAALELAIAAEHHDLASRIYRSLLLARPETYTTDVLGPYLAKVATSELARYPVLAFARGIAALSNPATRGAALEFFTLAADRLTRDLEGLTPAEALVQHTMRVAVLRFVGRFAESGEAARRAVAYYDDAVEDIDHPALTELRPMVLRHLAYSLFQIGDIEAATELVGRAVNAAQHSWSRNYTLSYGIGLNALDGRRAEAAETLRLVDPDAWPRDHSHTYLNALGRVGQAALLLDEFDCAGALAVYDGCESFLHTGEFWPFITWTLMMARLGLGDADVEAHRVEEALASRPAPPGVGANLGTSLVRGTLATLWLAAGRRDRAGELVGAATPYPGQLAAATVLHRMGEDPGPALGAVPLLARQPGHTARSRLALLTVGAAAALRAGQPPTARTLLRRAVAMHENHGVRAHLMMLDAADLAALRDLAAGLGPAAMAYLAGPVPAIARLDRVAEPLSERERVVLAAWARHRSRAAVAAALHVSENTVKSQLRSVYRKLGAETREEALQRAVELDLLTPGRVS